MLPDAPSEPRVSTGLDALDEVLGGLYWGDNVVWQLDRAPVEPFYRAIARLSGVFETKTSSRWAARSTPTASPAWRSSTPARASDAARSPATCCARSTACCHPRGRRLLLFESLDSMVRAWGVAQHARVLRALLPAAARGRRDRLLDDERARDAAARAGHRRRGRRSACCASTSAASGWSRRRAATTRCSGSVLHWHEEAGRPVLEPPEIVDRVAASLRAIRRARARSASTTSATSPA